MPEEYPNQTYYPAAKVRLMVRFDEFADKTALITAKSPKLPPQLLRGQKGFRAPLEVKSDPDSPAGVNRLVLLPKQGNSTNTVSPQKQDKSGDGLTQIVGGIIPKSATLSRNGIRTADSLSLTIRFLDLPIDPRTVRSCAVQFYLGTLTEQEYARGAQGQTRGDVFGANTPNASVPLNVVPDEYIDDNQQSRTNLRFEGFVDKWEVDWPDNGSPVVMLECRDNTTLLIDQNAPPRLAVNAKKPIDVAIAEYMANFPRFSGLSVEYRPGGVEIPKIGDTLAKTAFRPNAGPPPDGESAVWDYFTDVVGAIGHTIRLEGTLVIIQRVKTQVSSGFVNQRADDPYVPRKLQSGRSLNIRHFIYGRNVLSMKIARNYTVNALQNVEVRAYSPKRKKVLVARFPKVGDRVFNTVVRPGDIADQKWLVVRVGSMVEDEKALRLIAQNVYESINRSEMTVNVKTRNMSSFGGGNLDPDILDIQATDPIELLVSRDDERFSSTTTIESLMLVRDRAEQYLRAIGYDGEFAKAYALAYSNIGMQTTFRVKAANISWDIDSGVEIDILAVNYLEVRGEKIQLPPGEEVTQKQTAGKQTAKSTPKPLLRGFVFLGFLSTGSYIRASAGLNKREKAKRRAEGHGRAISKGSSQGTWYGY